MRIVLLTRGFPPEAIGGTEIYTQMLAAGLQALGHEVAVICIGSWTEGSEYLSYSSREVNRGFEVTRLHVNWRRAPDPNGYLYDNPVIRQFVSSHLDGAKPDVVHVVSCDRLSASILHAVHNAGLPIVLSLTDFWFLCPKLTLVRWNGELCDGNTSAWECLRCSLGNARAYTFPAGFLPERTLRTTLTAISRRPSLTRHRGLCGLALNTAGRKQYVSDALQLADYVTIASPFGARLFAGVFPDVRIHITPYGHDLSWMNGYSGKTLSRELRVGYIASLCEAKGPHVLLDAFRRLPLDLPVRLSVYGTLPSGAFGQMLLNRAAGDVRIQFCGSYDHGRSAEIYSNLDVLVIPSLWYDFPLVAHEALATRTVVVATDLPGLNEIIERDVNGLLFDRGDASALAGQLQRLSEDRSLVAALQAGRRQVRSITDAVAEFDEIYRSLVRVEAPTHE